MQNKKNLNVQFSCISTAEKQRQRDRRLLNATFDDMEFAFNRSITDSFC